MSNLTQAWLSSGLLSAPGRTRTCLRASGVPAVDQQEKGWGQGETVETSSPARLRAKSEAGTRNVAVPPHLLPTVAEHLSAHVGRRADALLFPRRPGDQRHLMHTELTKIYAQARAAAGRPDLRLHDLRHTGATYAAQTGATLAELMARLGHSTTGAALRYQHAAAGRDAQIAARLSELAGHAGTGDTRAN